MSRYRRITPINLGEQEEIISQRGIHNSTPKDTSPSRRAPMPRSPLALLLERLAPNRSNEPRNVREMVSSTCFNLRGVCKNVRAFANDMENLLSSVESITPVVEGVVAGYARSLRVHENPAVEKPPIAKADPFIPPQQNNEQTYHPENNPANTYSNQSNTQPNNNQINPDNPPLLSKTPSEADLKEFLGNPLVSTLMQMLAKNLGPKQ